MTPEKLLTVLALAAAFRAAILRADTGRLPLTLHNFPSGACGDASLLLAQFLNDSGLGAALYVWGLRGRYSHAWLELDGLIVDITADQFAGDPEAMLFLGEPPQAAYGVIATVNHTWHSQFEDLNRRAARIDVYDDITNSHLLEAYREICSRL